MTELPTVEPTAPPMITLVVPTGTVLGDDEVAEMQKLFNLVFAMLSCGMTTYEVFNRLLRLND